MAAGGVQNKRGLNSTRHGKSDSIRMHDNYEGNSEGIRRQNLGERSREDGARMISLQKY